LWHSILTYLNNLVSWISESWFSPIQSLWKMVEFNINRWCIARVHVFSLGSDPVEISMG
jgi:hypothetical protein